MRGQAGEGPSMSISSSVYMWFHDSIYFSRQSHRNGTSCTILQKHWLWLEKANGPWSPSDQELDIQSLRYARCPPATALAPQRWGTGLSEGMRELTSAGLSRWWQPLLSKDREQKMRAHLSKQGHQIARGKAIRYMRKFLGDSVGKKKMLTVFFFSH